MKRGTEMKKINGIIICIILLLSCKNKQELSKNDFSKNTAINENDITVLKNQAENIHLPTINEKLNMIIPEIGEEYYSYLYKLKNFDLLQDRETYGYEELIEQLKDSYLVVPLKPRNGEEAIIFNNNGVIRIYAQVVDGIIPAMGDGVRFQFFIVLGKFLGVYTDEYYNSKVLSDEIIVTFHNYFISHDNEKTWNYKIYAYYKMIE
jgi:hypothetical protein